MILPTARSIVLDVPDAEYARLLGLPRRRGLEGLSAERARSARDWYAAHGRPWAAARRVDVARLEPDGVSLAGGVRLRSASLRARLEAGEARSMAIVAVTAGREVDAESARLWATDRPDDAYFLDRIAAAVAEHLLRWASIAICRSAGVERLTALPALGPGCADWDFADQTTLYGQLDTTGPLELLTSGMMAPKNSMLASVGLSPHPFASSPEDVCRACDLSPCAFRRAPYDRARSFGHWPIVGVEAAQ